MTRNVKSAYFRACDVRVGMVIEVGYITFTALGSWQTRQWCEVIKVEHDGWGKIHITFLVWKPVKYRDGRKWWGGTKWSERKEQRRDTFSYLPYDEVKVQVYGSISV